MNEVGQGTQLGAMPSAGHFEQDISDEAVAAARARFGEAGARHKRAEEGFEKAKADAARLVLRQQALNERASRLFESLDAARTRLLDAIVGGAEPETEKPLLAALGEAKAEHAAVLAALDEIILRRVQAERDTVAGQKAVAEALAEILIARSELHRIEQLKRLMPAVVHAGGALSVQDPLLDALRSKAADALSEAQGLDARLKELDGKAAQLRATVRKTF
jgi:hypothetical protein